MESHDVFLKAIAENPHEDTDRLVYADWLTDEGDEARAEFIRLQCELARDEETRHLTSLRRAELREREAELREAHGKRWAGAAARFEPVFRRGFVERVTLSGANVSRCAMKLQQLRDAMPTIGGLKVKNGAGINLLLKREACNGLRELNLDGVQAGNAVAGVVADAGNLALERLSMRGCFLDESGMDALVRSPHLAWLRELDLGGNNLGGIGGEALGREGVFPRLETLNLESNLIEVDDMLGFAFSPVRRHLKRLNLCHNAQFDNEALRQLANPECSFKLRELDLGYTLVNDSGVEALAQSERFSDLESLRLDANNVTRHGAQALAESPHLGKLETLGMAQTHIGDEGVAALIDSPNLHGLRNLDVNSLRDAFGDAGDVPLDTGSIAALPGLSKLHRLNLELNNLDGLSVEELLASPHLEALRELRLAANPVGRRGAVALAATDHLTSLRRLGLNACDIDEEGVAALAQSTRLPALRHINMDHNHAETARLQFKGAIKSAVVGAVGSAKRMKLADRARLYSETREREI